MFGGYTSDTGDHMTVIGLHTHARGANLLDFLQDKLAAEITQIFRKGALDARMHAHHATSNATYLKHLANDTSSVLL